MFCAGQIALVPCTMELVKAGPRAQARMAFSHMRKVLGAVISGLTLGHVLQAHCYVTKRRDVKTVRDVWDDLLRTADEEVRHFWMFFLEILPRYLDTIFTEYGVGMTVVSGLNALRSLVI